MAKELTVNGTTISRKYKDPAGSHISPVLVKAPAHEIELDNVLIYRFSPTGTSGNIDPHNNTSSGVTLLSTVKKYTGENSIGDAKFLLLTAKRLDGTTAAIVNQLITVSVNSVEVGRIYVNGTTEKFGVCMFAVPDGRVDDRISLTGGANGRLNFAFTAADPSLEVYLEVGGPL